MTRRELSGNRPNVEICILTGGLSARMGRDKARLKIGGKTLLARVRHTASQTGWPVRTIRKDIVARCGPLGGVCTALKTTRAEYVLFLACDMPCVTGELLEKLIRAALTHPAVFATGRKGAGFPFVLRPGHLSLVEQLVAAREGSLQRLAAASKARRVGASANELFNVNTPEEAIQVAPLLQK